MVRAQFFYRNSLTRFRGMFLVSFDSSEVPSFAFKISFLCQIFKFSCLCRVSLPCEWSWAIRLSTAIVVAPDSLAE
jgi:hypothetical protein